MNGIPDIETTFHADEPEDEEERMRRSSCQPYIQIFKGEEMLYSSIKQGEKPKKIYGSDLSISFPIDIDIEGDILV